jgi:hypothetical protein
MAEELRRWGFMMNTREGEAESGTLGVLCKEAEKVVVGEFFELFKVPWEHYFQGKQYAAVICTDLEAWERVHGKQRVSVVFSSVLSAADDGLGIGERDRRIGASVQVGSSVIPIYGPVAALRLKGGDTAIDPLVTVPDWGNAGIAVRTDSSVTIRLGYDLFDEIRFLLCEGQPPENAHFPTLDLHIDFLRNWLVQEGVTLVEIPPTPYGYLFTACLTHDIDFVAIRDHFLDRAFFGYLYRASFGSLKKHLRGEMSLRQLAKNWLSIASLPLVYLGLLKDFWDPFDRYTEIEKGDSSTFFIIPFKNVDGYLAGNASGAHRRTKYDCDDVEGAIRKLLLNGKEVGVHGLDAWHDATRGAMELARLRRITLQERPGIRMHWLLFEEGSWRKLEEAGFRYDSTFGYNDAVGFRAGTTQAYVPPGTARIVELPLHIQDTALFYGRRLNLSRAEARQRCAEVLTHARHHGGVVTVLWHDRSAAPERQWEWLYESMLEDFRSGDTWITSAEKVVKWFETRRAIRFAGVQAWKDHVAVQLSGGQVAEPGIQVRVHPGCRHDGNVSRGSHSVSREYKSEDSVVVTF